MVKKLFAKLTSLVLVVMLALTMVPSGIAFAGTADFEFVDSSDLDQGEVNYYPGDFLTDAAGIVYYFNPNNTSIVVEDGQVILMNRVYTP